VPIHPFSFKEQALSRAVTSLRSAVPRVALFLSKQG
jgi:hypothetical protein